MSMELSKALEIFDFKSLSEIELTELKKRYKEQAKTIHPDKKGGDKEKFVELNKAYEFLKKLIEEEVGGHEDSDDKVKNQLVKKIQETEKHLVVHKSALRKNKDQVDEARKKVEQIQQDYFAKKQAVEDEFANIFRSLKREYGAIWYEKILPFLSKSRQRVYADKLAIVETEMGAKKADVENEFLRELIEVYGDSLNKIQKSLKEVGLK